MIRTGTLIVAAALMASPTSAFILEDEEKEKAFQEAESLLEKGEWKKAAKALKAYRKKYAETDEEKEDVAGLILRAEGEEELASIEKKYRTRPRVRSTVKSLRKFLDEFGSDDGLRERGEEFLETVRSEFVAIVFDFEEEEWHRLTESAGLTDTREESMVKHGFQAGHWRTGVGEKKIRFEPTTKDWTSHAYFCFWIYSHHKPRRPGFIMFSAGTADGHHFELTRPFTIDFEGWREVRIPYAGKEGQFGKVGKPHWGTIEWVQLLHPGSTGIAIDVVIDDIRLEKAVR